MSNSTDVRAAGEAMISLLDILAPDMQILGPLPSDATAALWNTTNTDIEPLISVPRLMLALGLASLVISATAACVAVVWKICWAGEGELPRFVRDGRVRARMSAEAATAASVAVRGRGKIAPLSRVIFKSPESRAAVITGSESPPMAPIDSPDMSPFPGQFRFPEKHQQTLRTTTFTNTSLYAV